ncbi:MAG TPA: hypothetical protein VFY89_03560 [Ktedonobacterales bacterium]
MDFGVSEYTLVFRRVLRTGSLAEEPVGTGGWVVARPALMGPAAVLAPAPEGARAPEGEVAQVLTVQIYSTLAMDELAYERFLARSGVLEVVLRRVGRVRLNDARSVETTRRRVRSLVMQAEVRHIADTLSA